MAAGALPAFVVLALFNRACDGSVIGSGYQVGDMFRVEHVWPNLFSYPRWLVGTQTAFILLAPIGLFLVRRDRLVLALAPAIVWFSYPFYAPLDHWSYLRFLLPAFPALLVLASTCAARAIPFALAGSFHQDLSRRVVIVALLGVVALTTWLDWPPAAEYAGVETVWLYGVADRNRPSHDVATRAIPH